MLTLIANNMQDRTSKEKPKKMDSTPHCSRGVPHPSTKRAQTALTSLFGWEAVHYGWYGRIQATHVCPTVLYPDCYLHHCSMNTTLFHENHKHRMGLNTHCSMNTTLFHEHHTVPWDNFSSSHGTVWCSWEPKTWDGTLKHTHPHTPTHTHTHTHTQHTGTQAKRIQNKQRETKKNGFNTTLFPGGPPPQY